MSRSTDIMKLLKANLQIALPTFTLTEAVSSGDPTLKVSEDATPATTEDVAFVKLISKSYSGFPTVSLASTVDGRPSLLQVVLEKQGANTLSVWDAGNLAKFWREVMAMNVDIELYMNANGDDPEEADIDAANLVAFIAANVRHPNVGM